MKITIDKDLVVQNSRGDEVLTVRMENKETLCCLDGNIWVLPRHDSSEKFVASDFPVDGVVYDQSELPTEVERFLVLFLELPTDEGAEILLRCQGLLDARLNGDVKEAVAKITAAIKKINLAGDPEEG